MSFSPSTTICPNRNQDTVGMRADQKRRLQAHFDARRAQRPSLSKYGFYSEVIELALGVMDARAKLVPEPPPQPAPDPAP